MTPRGTPVLARQVWEGADAMIEPVNPLTREPSSTDASASHPLLLLARGPCTSKETENAHALGVSQALGLSTPRSQRVWQCRGTHHRSGVPRLYVA